MEDITSLKEIQEELKKVIRRIDTLQTTVDLLYQDRNILEDIITRQTQVEQALHLNREHQTEVQKDIKADIREVNNTATDVKSVLDDKTFVVKSNNQNLFNKLMKIFSKEVRK